MNKLLRFSLITLLMMLCGSTFAQTNIWTEDWTGWEPRTNPAGANPNYTFTGTVLNDDNSYKSGTAVYNEKLAGGVAPELMLAKSGGTFTAKIPLNGASGTVTLALKSNNGKVDVTATGATVGEKTSSGNDYSYPITINNGATEISITFTANSSSNVRMDDFKLYSGESKKPAGLSWGTSSRTVTIGAEDNNFPTLTNTNNLTVTYSSSDESVATIDNNGEITLKAAGKTVIKAEFAGNDEYEAGYAEYTLTVKEEAAPATELSVAEALEKINALGTESTSYVDNKAAFNVKGYIVEITDISPKPDGYGNATFTIADSKNGSPVLTVYRCKDLENKDFTDAGKINVGDLVVVTGALQMYVKNGTATPEVSGPSGGPSCHLVSITSDVINVPVPTISGTAEFTDKTTVTITCSDEDAAIYYTIDGSDPKTSSTVQTYSDPFELTETATVKAYVEDVEGNTSNVVEKTFTKQEPTQIKAANIAALKALDKDTKAELTLTDAQVLYAWKSNNGNIQAYVRDASGAMCFDFRNNNTAGEKFVTNKIVNGTIMLTNSVYNGLPQASAYAETNDSQLTFADGSDAVPVSATIATVPNYICDLVEIEIDEIVSDEAEKPKYYAKSGDDQIQIYNQFHLAAYENEKLAALVGPASKVKGIAVIYQTTKMTEPIYEIYPVADGIVTGISEVNVNTVADGKIYNLAGQQVNRNFKGIVIKNGRKYIVK